MIEQYVVQTAYYNLIQHWSKKYSRIKLEHYGDIKSEIILDCS
jgi:hypothetical protein